MSVGTTGPQGRCDVEVPYPREDGAAGVVPAADAGSVPVPGVAPATRPRPAGYRPPRPEEVRGPARPGGRRAPAVLPPVRPRVAGGGVRALDGASHAAPAVAVPPAVLRRRRLAAVAVLGAVLGVLLGVLLTLVVPEGGSPVPAPSGTTVAVVGAGESLGDVAARVAPGADTETVVTRIRELNRLEGSSVAPGRPLVVPAAPSSSAG